MIGLYERDDDRGARGKSKIQVVVPRSGQEPRHEERRCVCTEGGVGKDGRGICKWLERTDPKEEQ